MKATQQSAGSMDWICLYIYTERDLADVLMKNVRPFIAAMAQDNGLEQFFFIRYWEKGPHIRLRMKGDRVKLEKGITQYEKMLQPARVERALYEPETDRYGGSCGIQVAEKHFEYSSLAVLSVLKEKDGNINKLTLAIQLHLGFVTTVGMGEMDMAIFFKKLFEQWFPSVYSGKGVMEEDLPQYRSDGLTAFRQAFARQQDSLSVFIKTLLAQLSSGVPFRHGWYNRWLKNTGRISKALQKCQSVSPLFRETGEFPPRSGMDRDRADRYTVYASYLHMTNNRLGLSNQEEAYVFFILHTVISAYAPY